MKVHLANFATFQNFPVEGIFLLNAESFILDQITKVQHFKTFYGRLSHAVYQKHQYKCLIIKRMALMQYLSLLLIILTRGDTELAPNNFILMLIVNFM